MDDVLGDIRRVGEATGAETEAMELVDSLKRRIDTVRQKASQATNRPKVACLEWIEPLLYAGHWIPEMVDIAGGMDCLGTAGQPSSRVEWADVVEQAPEVILVTPCGYDVRRGLQDAGLLTSRDGWDSLPAVRANRVFVLDAGSYTSRSGPRLVQGLEMLAEILHPELFSGMVPAAGAARVYRTAFST